MSRPRPPRGLRAVLLGVLLVTGGVASAEAALAACVPSTAPPSALQQLAAGRPVNGKSVGTDWDTVILGTVTEVRHKSPRFRYRITMAVDSTLGGELPPVFTFFGSSRGTYAFETGKVYAVPLTRRPPSDSQPASELWIETCDPVIPIASLASAHDVIARSKPGYSPSPTPSSPPTRTPTPSPIPSPTSAAARAAPPSVTAAAPAPDPTPTESELLPPATAVRGSRLAFPDRAALGRMVLIGTSAVGGVALLIAMIAAVESWWSRRHLV